MMKAILWTSYGAPDLLKFGETRKPIPKEDEVLIKVHAANVMPGDCEIRRFDMHVLFWLPLRFYFGLFKPKRPILGMDLSGEVEAVGEKVTNFEKGDEVFANTGLSFGAYAQYKCLKSSSLVIKKPTNMSFEEAATVPTSALNALHYLRKASIRPGEKVLINGAGGCFGTYAVQLAKLLWDIELTAVDGEDKLEMLKSIGADHVIDYQTKDWRSASKKYDVILDFVGKESIWRGMKSLKANGRYILATPWVGQVIQGISFALTSNKKFIFELAGEKKEDLEYIKKLIEEDKLKAIIDRKYSLANMVEAQEFVESKKKKGHVTVSIAH